MEVARSTRAWIETSTRIRSNRPSRVARSTRAWIETIKPLDHFRYQLVARSTRAWIETPLVNFNHKIKHVARSTRAWIETDWFAASPDGSRKSHALRVRGLKLFAVANGDNCPIVARSTRAWIETYSAPPIVTTGPGRTLYACVD